MYLVRPFVTFRKPLLNRARARQALQVDALRLAKSCTVTGGVR